MQETFCDFETAKILKELGFDQTTNEGNWYYILMRDESRKAFCCTEIKYLFNKFMNPILEPTWWQIKIWLWEKHKIFIDFLSNKEDYKDHYFFMASSATFENLISSEMSAVNPIMLEIEVIKNTVKYLYKQLKP